MFLMVFKLKKNINVFIFFLDICLFERINMLLWCKVYVSSVINVWLFLIKI